MLPYEAQIAVDKAAFEFAVTKELLTSYFAGGALLNVLELTKVAVLPTFGGFDVVFDGDFLVPMELPADSSAALSTWFRSPAPEFSFADSKVPYSAF